MKALTICQPYAELILRGPKRVENRTWYTRYRGMLLIHAGKSRDWLTLDLSGQRDELYDLPLAHMDFGALVGACRLTGCLRNRVRSPIRDPIVLEAWPWLADHEHAEGPNCLILEDVRRFRAPIPYRGQPGLFEVPYEIVGEALSTAIAVAVPCPPSPDS